ncbi:amidohydrolase [Mariniblastus fucicola]|uniref:N-substituted formamide deformylase n=1 Tax=Mariniblastus fucicola TaxID=980251 RepID=A0A5B9P745_9BACT|nr:amidohydrolase [Mariniblastus fucicola]QEG20760.1 N-substituted formamide deformylase precursor [Mariniblastus fucicola]
MRNMLQTAILLFLATICVNPCFSQDMAIINANVATMDSDNPKAEAFIVKDGRIAAVGTSEEISKQIDADMKVLDLDGKFLMPGFIEGHGHFLMLGEMRMNLDLTKANSWDEIVDQVRLAAANTPPGKWIIGRGWHQSKWDAPPSPNVEGYPTHESLSQASPNNPVLLTHASGHMDFANAYAMRLAGVEDETKNPKGGEILRNEDGSATGVFRERASGLIHSARYADEGQSKTKVSDVAYLNRAAELASEECVRKGITSFQDAGMPFAQIDYLKSVVGTRVKPRLWVMVRDSNQSLMLNLKSARTIGFADNHLTVRAIKRAIDGALGAHGAWLLQPYEDMPLSRGLNTRSIASIEEAAALAIKHDYQFCVHAIGDRANREVLDIFEKQFTANPSEDSRRWRIEHAQHLHPDDIPRFGKLGVIAAMQAVHCTSDAIFVPKRLGQRRSKDGAYVWQSLLKSGAIVTNGTDAPVEDVDPIPCFFASVTRQLKPGVTFFPEQCMSRQQALEAYTINNAKAAFEEDIKGSIEVGKLADFVVLSNDLLTCADDEILDTKVLQTVIGGETVYEAKPE